ASPGTRTGSTWCEGASSGSSREAPSPPPRSASAPGWASRAGPNVPGDSPSEGTATCLGSGRRSRSGVHVDRDRGAGGELGAGGRALGPDDTCLVGARGIGRVALLLLLHGCPEPGAPKDAPAAPPGRPQDFRPAPGRP